MFWRVTCLLACCMCCLAHLRIVAWSCGIFFWLAVWTAHRKSGQAVEVFKPTGYKAYTAIRLKLKPKTVKNNALLGQKLFLSCHCKFNKNKIKSGAGKNRSSAGKSFSPNRFWWRNPHFDRKMSITRYTPWKACNKKKNNIAALWRHCGKRTLGRGRHSVASLFLCLSIHQLGIKSWSHPASHHHPLYLPGECLMTLTWRNVPQGRLRFALLFSLSCNSYFCYCCWFFGPPTMISHL